MTQTNLISTKKSKIRRPRFYRDRRVVLSFLISIPTCYFVGIFPAIFMHLATGAVLDWWFFEFKKFKESDTASDNWLRKAEMSREQLDSYSDTFLSLRNYTLLACCIAGLCAYGFKFSIGYEGAFCAAYFITRLLSTFYLSWNNIRYPFWGSDNNKAADCYHNGKYQPLGRNMDDMMDTSNPVGFVHPASPNYIFK